MFKRTPFFLLAFLVLGALTAGAASAEEFTLRFRPEEGTKLEVVQVIEQSMTMNMPQVGSQEMQTDMRVESTQTVLAAAESGASRVEFLNDRTVMSMRRGDVEMMSFDTDQEIAPDDPTGSTLGAMVGKTYVLEIDELGGLVGTDGLAEMLEEVMASVANPQVLAIMQQTFNEDSMLQTMQMSMPVFPKEALGTGESWRRDFEMSIPLLGTVRVDATYTIGGLDQAAGEPCVRLDARMLMEFDLDSPLLEQMAAASGANAEFKMDVDDMDASGWMCIARSDGVTLDSEVSNQLAMRISVAAEGQEPMEMEMLLDQVTRQTTAR